MIRVTNVGRRLQHRAPPRPNACTSNDMVQVKSFLFPRKGGVCRLHTVAAVRRRWWCAAFPTNERHDMRAGFEQMTAGGLRHGVIATRDKCRDNGTVTYIQAKGAAVSVNVRLSLFNPTSHKEPGGAARVVRRFKYTKSPESRDDAMRHLLGIYEHLCRKVETSNQNSSVAEMSTI